MDKHMINRTIKISAGLSILIFIVIYSIEGDVTNFLTIISKSVSAITLLWILYFNFGWKYKLFNKIFKIPNLNGTWSGTLLSDWKDENGVGKGEIEFYIVIKQRFLNFHIRTFTENYAGQSYIEKIDFNEKEGETKVAYFYCADIISIEEDTRQGVTELRLLENSVCLMGKYWTRNKTCGTINVRFSRKEQFSTYDEIKNNINRS